MAIVDPFAEKAEIIDPFAGQTQVVESPSSGVVDPFASSGIIDPFAAPTQPAPEPVAEPVPASTNPFTPDEFIPESKEDGTLVAPQFGEVGARVEESGELAKASAKRMTASAWDIVPGWIRGTIQSAQQTKDYFAPKMREAFPGVVDAIGQISEDVMSTPFVQQMLVTPERFIDESGQLREETQAEFNQLAARHGKGAEVALDVINSVVDTTQYLATMRLANVNIGGTPTRAAGDQLAKQMTARLQSAGKLGVFKAITSEADSLEERAKIGAVTAMYMSTPAASGMFENAKDVFIADLIMNSAITAPQLFELWDNPNIDNYDKITETLKMVGADVVFSAMTRTMRNDRLSPNWKPMAEASRRLNANYRAGAKIEDIVKEADRIDELNETLKPKEVKDATDTEKRATADEAKPKGEEVKAEDRGREPRPGDDRAGLGEAKDAQVDAEKFFEPDPIKAINEDKKSRRKIVYMPIDQFLEYSTPLRGDPVASKMKSIGDSLDAGNKIRVLPELFVKVNKDGEAEIIDHDGRHRALALKERGAKTIPVVVESGIGERVLWDKDGGFDEISSIEKFPTTLKTERGEIVQFPLDREGNQIQKPVTEPEKPVAGAQAKETITPQEKEARGKEGTLTGISRDWNNQWRKMEDELGLPAPDRVRQQKAVQDAIDEGLVMKVDELMTSKAPLTDKEVGAFLVRKTALQDEMKALMKQMEEAAKANDDERLAELAALNNEKIEFGLKLTDAVARRATTTAQGLAAMNMMMDTKTFELVNVETLARATKGEALEPKESGPLREKVEELEAVNADLAKMVYPTPSALINRMMIIDEVERAYRRLKKGTAKRVDKNADVKIIRKRQDAIFDAIDEINRGKPVSGQIKKVQSPDSEGYLEMLTNLRKELAEVRKKRGLEKDIAQLEKDIKAGDISKHDIRRKVAEEDHAILLLRARKTALGNEINRQIADLKPKTIGSVASDVWDVFRNIRLTADAGHLLRQGGVVMSNPKMWTGDIQQFYKESAKALIKENADVLDATVMSHKNYNKWKLAGLAFIEEGQQLDAREEILMNGLLGKAPLGIGTAQKAFGRVQISGTNLLRLLAAESYAGGKELTSAEMKDVAMAVNIMTGRGATVKDPKFNNILNKILTSPSFTASRFQAPFLLAHKRDGKFLWQNKALRKRIIEDSAWFIGQRMALMGAIALALPDAEIGDDPDHWTYGRLIVHLDGGKSRVYDPWAGIASAYRALAPISEGKFGEALSKTFEGRKHPAFSSAIEVATGKAFYGGEIGRGEAVVRSLLPISVEGMREAIKEDTGVFDLVAAVSTDVLGVGSVLVDTDKTKRKQPSQSRRRSRRSR